MECESPGCRFESCHAPYSIGRDGACSSMGRAGLFRQILCRGDYLYGNILYRFSIPRMPMELHGSSGGCRLKIGRSDRYVGA